ncbi:MAG: hypothetical protein HC927_05000 [Deltaproteobacteria bacterium]|nr:hypothetical protein [Deltaproteobacteria bacterium]
MHRAVIYARKNNRKGTNPKTGLPWRDGDEFVAQAKKFRDLLRKRGVKVELFEHDTTTGPFPDMDLGYLFGPDLMAVFTHGFPTYVSGGVRRGSSKQNALAFHQAFQACSYALFACSTGKLDDGFAYWLSRWCGRYVSAHQSPGHTVRSPDDTLFYGGERRYSARKLPGGMKAWRRWLDEKPERHFLTWDPELWFEYLDSCKK